MTIPKNDPPATETRAAASTAAANEDAIEGGGRPAGWDPFEVWRTRVRDARKDKRPDSTDEIDGTPER